jgi:hypothetical protein
MSKIECRRFTFKKPRRLHLGGPRNFGKWVSCRRVQPCPIKLAERQAKALGLQIIRASFLRVPIRVSLVRRTENDEALEWFFAELRKAVLV